MQAQATAAFPWECCGFLLGRRGENTRVTRLLPAANCHPDPTRHFTIDPRDHIALLRQLRQREPDGEALIGHYHSHPNGLAQPSARDLAAANDAELLWVIIGCDDGGVAAFRPETGADGRITGFASLPIDAWDTENP